MELPGGLQDPNLPTLVQFHATWCGPCKAIAPAVSRLEAEFAGRVAVRRIDVDQDEASARALGVRGVPTIVVFREGREVGRSTGFASETALRRLFESALASDGAPRPFVMPWKGILVGTGLSLTLLPRWNPEMGLAKWVGLAMVVWGLRDACPLCALGTRGIAGAFGRIGKGLRRSD